MPNAKVVPDEVKHKNVEVDQEIAYASKVNCSGAASITDQGDQIKECQASHQQPAGYGENRPA